MHKTGRQADHSWHLVGFVMTGRHAFFVASWSPFLVALNAPFGGWQPFFGTRCEWHGMLKAAAIAFGNEQQFCGRRPVPPRPPSSRAGCGGLC